MSENRAHIAIGAIPQQVTVVWSIERQREFVQRMRSEGIVDRVQFTQRMRDALAVLTLAARNPSRDGG